MKLNYSILIILAMLSCNTIKVPRTEINTNTNGQGNSASELLVQNNQCDEIIRKSIGTFLDAKTSAITWEEEHNVLPCWISAINSGNSELEDILLERLNERSKLIQDGGTKYLNTLRITKSIFSSISSYKMLEAAYSFALIDTCIYYPNEGAFHVGWVGINHLLKMTSSDYQAKFNSTFLEYILENDALDRYDENSCEYLEIVYLSMLPLIQKDYAQNAIMIKQKIDK